MMMDLVRADVSVVDLMAAGRRKNPTIADRFFRNIQVSDGPVAQWHARRQGADTPA